MLEKNTMLLTLLIACASGLAIIAFRAPRIYIKLYLTLIGIPLVVAILAAAWTAGHSSSFQEMLKFVSPEKINDAASAHSDSGIPIKFFLYLSLSTFYPVFLRWLAQEIIDHIDDKEPKRKLNDE